MKRIQHYSDAGKEGEEQMMVEINSEVIAEVRNALQIIMSNAELIPSSEFVPRHKMMIVIVEQVKRIVSLLPPVKFEG